MGSEDGRVMKVAEEIPESSVPATLASAKGWPVNAPRLPAPPAGGIKFDTGKVRTDLLPMGALECVAPYIGRVEEDPWAILAGTLPRWRREGEGLHRVAASLLVLLTRELRGDVRVHALYPDCGPALLEVAKVLTFGASKYGPNNWQGLENFTDRYYAAVLRHLFVYGGGEQWDPESGLSHLAHATCGALFLLSREVGHDPG